MSVRVSERSEGDLDVIIKAKQMAVYTVEVTNNTNYFAKRYRLTITDRIVNKSMEIFMLLYEANEIYPRNKKDFEERQRNQRRAMACCRTLVAMIDMSKTLFHLPDDKVKYWTKLVVEIRYMTAAWYKKELDRFGRQFTDKAEAKEELFITELELALLEMVKEMRG
jgi:hypothetical protein